MLKWVVIVLAVAGFAIGLWTVTTNERANPEPPPASPPSVNPFEQGIAATGLVEAASRNVRIAAPEPGLVRSVAVQVGDRVQQGDVLFRLDTRLLEVQLTEAKASLAVAQAKLAKAKAAPRGVTLPPLEAAVRQAEAQLSLARSQYQQTKEAFEQDAATGEELARTQSQLQSAKGAVAEAKARLKEAQAGTWSQDLAIARQEVDQARAAIKGLNQRIHRLTVRSPIAGTVLKRRIEPGEYANPSANQAAMVLGRIETLHVRAKVNEQDVPQLRQGAKAIARVRGAADINVPLKMLRIEPLAEPKEQLTGVATELVDTRVIEVVFKVTGNENAPLYPGILVDVFIEGPTAATRPGRGRGMDDGRWGMADG